MTTQKVHKLEVDTSRGEVITMKVRGRQHSCSSLCQGPAEIRSAIADLAPRLRMRRFSGMQVDLTFPRLPCEWLSIIALDVSGRVQSNIDHDLNRQRLTNRGRPIAETEKHGVGASADELPHHLHPDTPPLPKDYCGSCYGADATEGQCCNTCEDVRAAYRTKGWGMPIYETVEQCEREGFQESILSVVGPPFCPFVACTTLLRPGNYLHANQPHSVASGGNHEPSCCGAMAA